VSAGTGPSRLPVAGVAGLVGLVLLLFRRALFEGRVFYERDVHLQWHAQATALGRMLAELQFPAWTPYGAFGHPLLAVANYQAAYPMSWLLALVPPPAYYTAFVVVHVVLAAWGAALLGRRMGLGGGAAVVAAACFVLSGPLVSCVSLWNHLAGAAWLPWALWAADTAVASGRLRHAALWGIVLALPILAGAPELAGLALLGSCAALVARVREPGGTCGWRGALGRAIAALLLAGALSAVQWLPGLDLAGRSVRAGFPAEARVHWSLFPWSTPALVLPIQLETLPLRPEWRARLAEPDGAYFSSHYLGLTAGALVIAGLALPGRRRGTLAGLAIAGLLLALGRHAPVYGALVALLPPLQMLRFPSKALLLLSLCWALLAGMGYERWAGASLAARRRIAAAFAVLAVIGLGALWSCAAGASSLQSPFLAVPPAVAADTLASASARLRPSVLLGALAALLLAWDARRVRGTRAATALVALAAIAELWIAHDATNPTAPASLYARPPQFVGTAPAADLGRVYVYDYFQDRSRNLRHLGAPSPALLPLDPRLPPGLAWVYALRDYGVPPTLGAWNVEGSFDIDLLGLESPRMAALTRRLRELEGQPGHLRLLQLAGVDRVVALHEDGLGELEPVDRLRSLFSRDVRVFRVPNPRPRASVVEGARVVPDEAVLDALTLPGFDPAREVLLDHGSPQPARPGFEGSARETERAPGRLRVRAHANRSAYLVLLDAHDPGWRARVDGASAPVLRANGVFLAVPVPAGEHFVELRYAPAAIRIGLGVSLAAAVLAAVLAAWPERRQRTRLID